MSLKFKIWASYIIMVTAPLLLAVLSAKLILTNYEEDHQIQIIETAQEESLQEKIAFMEELEHDLADKPDYFKDPFYLAQINEKISSVNMGVLIQHDGEFISNSVPVNVEKLKPNLLKLNVQDVTEKWTSAIIKDYIVRCVTCRPYRLCEVDFFNLYHLHISDKQFFNLPVLQKLNRAFKFGKKSCPGNSTRKPGLPHQLSG